MDLVAAEVTVAGDVQGVGFRWWAVRQAETARVSGWVRNNYDGSVSALVEGERADVEAFIEQLREGPRMARVLNVRVAWQEYTGSYDGFDIRR